MSSRESFIESAQQSSPRSSRVSRHVDTLQQGCEMEESRVESVVTTKSASSSPIRYDLSSQRSLSPVNRSQQYGVAACDSAVPKSSSMNSAHILIDPLTGQQYILQTSTTQQPVFYQPIYSTPPPIFYQPFTNQQPQGAYLMPQPISPNINFVPNQQSHSNFVNNQPLSSINGAVIVDASSDKNRSMPSGEQYVQSQVKVQNEELLRTCEIKMQQIIAMKSQSPLCSPKASVHNDRSKAQSSSNQASESSAPRSSTSQRTPLFGSAPFWWGDDTNKNKCSSTDVESKNHHKISNTNVVSDSELINLPSTHQTREVTAASRSNEAVNVEKKLKGIRMDIDLNKSFDIDDKPKDDKIKHCNVTPPTAFTVCFDKDDDSNLSLQDAARKTRRLLRRITSSNTKDIIQLEHTNPKQYLLNKMLMGSGANIADFNGAPEFVGTSSNENDEKREFDSLSEAGTYVVDEKDRQLDQMVASQRSDSDSDSDTVSTTKSGHRSTSAKSTADLSQISTELHDSNKAARSEQLLKELIKLGNAPSSPPTSSSTALLASKSIVSKSNPAQLATSKPTRLSSSSTSSHANCLHPSSFNKSPFQNTNFRRADGGRYSMRNQVNAAKSSANKPTSSRAGTTNKNTPSVPKESAEMTAWLRRKDYNPMKSAADARKLQQLKMRSDNFTSNRSVSFNQYSTSNEHQCSRLMRSELNKGGCVNRSEDDLRASPSKVFEVHSKGVSDQRSVELSRKLSAAKKNQVDETIQQLTEKCHRSIELIRNAHHGELSKSIENMLENALKRTDTPGDDHRSLNHQLNTLLNAFDAIEKYLSQVSSISTPNSVASSPTRSTSPTAYLKPSSRSKMFH